MFTKILFLLPGLFASSSVFAHGISETDQMRMLAGGYFEYIYLGASHMLTGYDHLLFLFGVIFFLSNFKDIVKFVTAFTIGHSITLIFATFLGITANYYLIDAVIAISVCYKGFDNNDGFKKYLGVKSPNLLMVVLIFGLIHGFGLSTRLQQLPLGADSNAMLMRIISFNVGVEVGQIVALIVMLGLLAGWRRTESFTKFSKVANDGLVLAGFLLLMMQLHGFMHQAAPEENMFDAKTHKHIHEDMAHEKEQVKNFHGDLLK